MEKFLKQQTTKLQPRVSNLHNFMSIKEVECVVKILPCKKKYPAQMTLLAHSTNI